MSEKEKILKVCITGAAGQIGYSFIPLLLVGTVFGPETFIELTLIDIAINDQALKGIILEIEDCAYPQCKSVTSCSDPFIAFKDIDVGIFIGGFPRKEGMQRKDLLSINGKIFKEQASALNQVASKNCKVLVVANPANTNCTILQEFCPNIPKENFTALTRLDQNRAKTQIALKSGAKVSDINNVFIWGNHSSTQYPDVSNGTIGGTPICDVIKDQQYLQHDFIDRVQKRGAEVLSIRKFSSVFSAANAVKDHLKDWYLGNPNHLVSMAVISDGTHYGVPAGICFSFPIKCKGNFQYEIVDGFKINEFSQEKINITTQELIDEKKDALE